MSRGKSGKVEKEVKSKGFWKMLFPYMKPSARNIVLAMVLSIVVGACVSLQPFAIKYIVDTGIGSEPIVLFGREVFRFSADAEQRSRLIFIGVLCASYVLLSLVRVVCWGFSLSNMIKVQERTTFLLRSRFFGHVQRLCMRFRDKNSAGELYNYIMGTPMSSIRTYLVSVIQTVPWQIVSLVISVIALLSHSWELTLLVVATASVMALLNRRARGKVRRASREHMAAEKETSKTVTDMLNGAEAIKIYSIEEESTRRFEDSIEHLKNAGIHFSMSNWFAGVKVEYTQYVGTAAVYLLGGILCVLGKLAVGELYLFLSTMTTMFGILTAWLNMTLTHQSASVAMERIDKVIAEHSTTPEVRESARRAVGIERESAIRHEKPCIRFQNVSFGYENKRVFENLNCNIGYNESIGLVGGSGSGKSTFTKLLMRLYEVDGGEIRLHDRNVKDYETHELRLSFGVVPQNPFIFYGTIWDNIRIVRPEATNKEIIDAMELARVHEFVNELPMGWSTVIGDGALGLSGGQKQRLAIARAILKKPDIFIFDEATSALDNVSEHLIQEAMEDLMRTHTVLIVAHRLSTIRNVNRILVFDHGNIVDEGSYNELASREGLFRTLLDAAGLPSEAEVKS